jgi:6-phosphogluconolactonase
MTMASPRLEVRVVPTDAIAATTASTIAGDLRRALHHRDRAAVAFSGGATPIAMLRALSLEALEWTAIDVFQVDERVTTAGSPQRNATALQRQLTDHVGARVHLIEVDAAAQLLTRNCDQVAVDAELNETAAHYERTLDTVCGGVLDVVHLGLGADGHCASWGPGDPVVDAVDRDVAPSLQFGSARRVTLTPGAVNRARQRIFLVTGAEKADALARLVSGDPWIPASRVSSTDTVVFADEAAASLLR